MTDLFQDKAEGWDARPVPQQISAGIAAALEAAITLDPGARVMDFGAGTGLLTGHVAPRVASVLAVDVSPAMLAQLAAKTELAGKVATVCQDIVTTPLGQTVDVIVSAMAMHHVADTRALLRALHAHLEPGGCVALADLDAEDGSFHPPDAEGVHHAGFDRAALIAMLEEAGFVDVSVRTACEVHKEGRAYPIFLMTASRAA